MLGEALVDLFVAHPGETLADTPHFVPFVGGAPANVAVQLARLGVDVALWSAVGDDAFGARLVTALDDEGVATRHVKRVSKKRTGLTFVEVDLDGERRFTPRREEAAIDTVSVDDLPLSTLRAGDVLHHGTVLLRAPRSRATTRRAVRAARAAGAIVSLDVNLRPGLFSSRDELRALAVRALRGPHVVKATREEARFLVDGRTDDALIDALLAEGARLVCLTLDVDGAILASRRARVHVPAPHVRTVDATGAGDAFMGATLAALVARALDVEALAGLDERALVDIGRAACAAGAAAITAMGATTAMLDARGLARAIEERG